MATDIVASAAVAENASTLPIFAVERVEMQFSIASDFVAAQIANNVLVLALQTGRIIRIDLDQASEVDDIDLPKKVSETGIIRRLFLDPTASHLIINTTLGECFYLHTQSRQPKQLSKLKGISIESISWNPSQPTASTREILVGASDGTVYETYIESTTDFYRREEKYLKSVYKAEGPVVGMWTDQLPGRTDTMRVMIATPTKILHFVGKLARHGGEGGGPAFAKFFETEAPVVHDVGSTPTPNSSALVVTSEAPDAPGIDSSKPDRIFAWLSGKGVFHGRLMRDPVSSELGNRVFSEARTLPSSKVLAPNRAGARSKSYSEGATLVALTQWHILQLVGNRVVAINRLDDSIVFDQIVLTSGQRAVGLLADLKKNTYWLFTSRDIFEIVTTDEDRDVWKIMLKAQKFEEATQYANSPAQKDAVASASGDYLMKKGQYLEAAGVYGKSTKPFEQVALAFIDQGQKDALRKYLLTKLSFMKKTAIMQRIMLASWLTEVFMSKLNSLDDMHMTRAELAENQTPADVTGQLEAVRREFQDFTRKYKADLDRKTIYDIINSHAREDELLFFATTIDDYNYILSYWIQREKWPEALKALNRQTDPNIIYKYASVLMANTPVEFIDVLMRQSNLDARKLIPALLNYNHIADVPLNQNQAVRYLLFEINQHGSNDAAVHNTLISIYAAHPTRNETALLTYLQSQTPATATSNKIETLQKLPYDADFALRLCIQHSRVRSCVHIYTTMGQYASAVALALQHQETDLAISIAESFEHDPALRKKLWLAIARSVISSTTNLDSDTGATKAKDQQQEQQKEKQQPKGMAPKISATNQTASISVALSLLRRAPAGVLRIEDLLPLFPDFVLIDAFKDEICSALESYSSSIDELKSEMDDSAAAAARIQRDVAALGASRWVLVEPGEACSLCGLPLLERRFWVWNCGHGAHGACVEEAYVKGKAGKVVARQVVEFRSALEGGGGGVATSASGTGLGTGAAAGPAAPTTTDHTNTTTAEPDPMTKRERARKDMDDILGRECLRCGDVAVRAVDEPFVSARDYRAEWAL